MLTLLLALLLYGDLPADTQVMLEVQPSGAVFHQPGCDLVAKATMLRTTYSSAQGVNATPHADCYQRFFPQITPSAPDSRFVTLRGRISTCSGMRESKERLACFDGVARTAEELAHQQVTLAPAAASAEAAPVAARPAASVPAYKAPTTSSSSSSSSGSSGMCWVNGYTTKTGKRVSGYYRKCR